jgi:hypothetical protein
VIEQKTGQDSIKFNLRISKFIDFEEDYENVINYFRFFVEILDVKTSEVDEEFRLQFADIRQQEEDFLDELRQALANLPGNVYLGIFFFIAWFSVYR